jgi:zinc protease
VKAEQETQLYGGLSTALGKANAFAQNNELYGDPAYPIASADAIRAVTVEQVRDVYDRYIKDKPRIVTSFVPEGQIDLAVSGSELATVWIEEVTAGNANESVSAGAIATYERTETEHDRSEPDFGELPLLTMPDVWTHTYDNGVVLRGIESAEIPLVQFELVLPGGRWAEEAGQNGRLSLLADLMNEGTADRSAAEWEQAVGLLGSGITAFASADALTIRGTSLSRNLDETVALIEELLGSPRFTDHPFGRVATGTTETIEGLGLADLQAAHASFLTAPARLNIAGSVDEADAVNALARLADLIEPGDAPARDAEIDGAAGEDRVFFVDMPDAKQSVLRIGTLVPDTSDPDFVKIRFANEKLGGGIAGDLAQTLRIEKGYTYGAYSNIPRNTVERPFTIGTSVRANATRPSLETIREMLIGYPDTLTADAAEATQQKIVKSSARAFESLGAKLGTVANIGALGLSDRYVEDEQKQLLDMTPEEFQRVAREYFAEDKMVYLIVGDAATQLAEVERFAAEAGLGDVVRLDKSGDRLE